MTQELITRITKAISHLESVKSRAVAKMGEIDKFLEENEDNIVEEIFLTVLNREGGEYKYFDSYRDILDIPRNREGYVIHSFPHKEVNEMFSIVKSPLISVLENVSVLYDKLYNCLEGLKYVNSLSCIPEDLVATLREAEEYSPKLIDEEVGGVEYPPYSRYTIFPDIFTHKGKYYLFIPDSKEEVKPEELIDEMADKYYHSHSEGSIFSTVILAFVMVMMAIIALVMAVV